jgi:ubiquinone/menaquinone biosynthesis C-methylase UbiE
MLNRILHRIAAYSSAYDALQVLAGRPLISRALRKWLASANGLTIDVGGGTGNLKALLPAGNVSHVCVDRDPRKLSGYVAKFRDARPLYGDATRLPVRNRTAPVVAMVAVSHHLTDVELDEALGEIARIQAPAGTFFFFDALLVPERLISRFLWARDRGAHPRTAVDIVARLQKNFQIVEQFEYTVWHRYLACRCRPL